MKPAIETMLNPTALRSAQDYENALKELFQQLALLGLWRGKFFEHAAFYGGTALRLLFGLDRFSEDLDFSLRQKQADFDFSPYLNSIETELAAWGFEVTAQVKEKTATTNITSAFVKGNTRFIMMQVNAPDTLTQRLHRNACIKVKCEIDTDPPLGFSTVSMPMLDPIPFHVRTYALPDLFAGKLSAVLCRRWQNRVKGRDWYDFLWFIQKKIPVNLTHLESRLRQVGFYEAPENLSLEALRSMLIARIDTLDIALAREDVAPFIADPENLAGWDASIFRHAVMQLCATIL